MATSVSRTNVSSAEARRSSPGAVAVHASAIWKVFQLAWPIAAGMLGQSVMGLVDTKLVGGLGAAALGGVGLATTVHFLGYRFAYGVLRGVKICSAHAVGAGRVRDAASYAVAGALLGFLFGTAQMLVCLDAGFLFRFLGTDADVSAPARDFLGAVALGAPATCALAALIQHCQATGDSRTPMLIGLVGNVINAALAWLLIHGHGGLPALGVKGAGYATAISETVELAVMIVLLHRAASATRVEGAGLRLRRAVREVCGVGGPTGAQYAAEMIALVLFAAVLSGMSEQESAAHQIALNVIRVSFLAGLALSEAATVLVGQSLGRRNIAEADRYVNGALGLATAAMGACGLTFAVGGKMVAPFFTEDVGTAAIAARLFVVSALVLVLEPANMIFRGALRGAKDVRIGALLGIVSVWVAVPTGAYFLGKLLGLGALGGWIGYVGESLLGAALGWHRWTYGAWRAEQPAPR